MLLIELEIYRHSRIHTYARNASENSRLTKTVDILRDSIKIREKRKQRLAEVEDFLGNNCFPWFEGSGKLRQAVTEVLCRLPQKAADMLLCNSKISVVDGSSSAAWPWRQVCPPHSDYLETFLYIVVLRQELREMPYRAVVGEVAHEFAHVFLEHRLDAPEKAQQEADETARQWGFEEEIDLLNRQ